MSAPRPNRLSRYARRTALALALLLAALAILFVSIEPAIHSPARPTSRDLEAAREVWQALKSAKGATTAKRVRADNEAIVGIAALASDTAGFARFDAGVANGVLSGRASVSLPLGLWINGSATVSGKHAGFPAYALKVGRVRFPMVASRWAADLVRFGLRLKGADIPPLDEMVRHFGLEQQAVVADLVLPADSGMVDGIISANAEPLDQPLVSDIYCRLAAAQRTAPVANLSQLVRRAFDPVHAEEGEDFSRATFVALSFLVVGEKAEALAPSAAALAEDCPHPRGGYLLQQREDLAKHWTFSAGLTAVLGEETAASLGELKELDDSLSGGSGFSFVDLAADRSGMHTALRTLNAASSASTAAELSRATDQDLLPTTLLQAPEELPEKSFIDAFGALDRERYRQAVAAIDRSLARQRATRAGGT